MARAYLGLARWGITLILPESLPAFQEIVIADRRMNRGEQLAALAVKTCEAIFREKYMIYFGVRPGFPDIQGHTNPRLFAMDNGG